MIVIGTDTHKTTHTAAGVERASGQLVDERTAAARRQGFEQLLAWGRALGPERIWAIEDCRHVSGSFERFLVARGERVVRVAPRLMGETRKGTRTRGKSDSIDALAVARAALKEGPETLPAAALDRDSLEIKLLLDHREDLVHQRLDDQRRLRWHLHDLWPELEIPAGALDRDKWLDKLSRRLARAQQSVRVEIARELVRAIRARVRRERELERELALRVQAKAPQLLELPGCGPLTAAKIVAETAGVAPVPASSGRRDRQRLDRGGNRQLNCAFHRLAVAQGRFHAEARAYLERKQAEGKGRMEALRCLKRHLVRRVWQLLRASTAITSTTTPLPASCGIGLT